MTSSRSKSFTAFGLNIHDETLMRQRRMRSIQENRVERLEIRRMMEDMGIIQPLIESQHNSISPTSQSIPIDTIRQVPEVMLQIYSFLPLKDRIFSLYLVDKTFMKDPVLSGVRYSVYGPSRMTLREAGLQFRFWLLLKNGRWSIGKNKDRKILEFKTNKLFEITHHHTRLEARKLPRQDRVSTWMDDLVSMERVKARVGFCGKFNLLSELIKEADLMDEFQEYRTDVEHCSTSLAPKRLDPGLSVVLPHSELGRVEYNIATCSECGKLHVVHHSVRCEHDHKANLCRFCDRHAELVDSCSPDRTTDVREEWGCYACKLRTKRKHRRFRADIRERLENDEEFQNEVTEHILESNDPTRQEGVLQCLLAGTSPRTAFVTPQTPIRQARR